MGELRGEFEGIDLEPMRLVPSMSTRRHFAVLLVQVEHQLGETRFA